MMSKLCQVCNTNEPKYRCPRCEQRTCSLTCCQKHKETFECNGRRDKTAFVAKEDFDESGLISDYRFLEEQARVIDAASRDTLLTAHSPHHHQHHHFIPPGFEHLRKFIFAQFGTKLKFMPDGSSRHTYNKSTFDRVTNHAQWSLELVFHVNSAKQQLKFSTKDVLFSARNTLRNILNDFYSQFKNELFVGNDSALHERFNDPFATKQYDQDVHVLHQVLDFVHKRKFYLKLDLDKSLEENLRRQTVVEYPALYIVRNSDLSSYPLRTSNEPRRQPQKREQQLQQQHHEQQREDEWEHDDEGANIETLQPKDDDEDEEDEDEEEEEDEDDEPPEEISNKKFKNVDE